MRTIKPMKFMFKLRPPNLAPLCQACCLCVSKPGSLPLYIYIVKKLAPATLQFKEIKRPCTCCPLWFQIKLSKSIYFAIPSHGLSLEVGNRFNSNSDLIPITTESIIFKILCNFDSFKHFFFLTFNLLPFSTKQFN